VKKMTLVSIGFDGEPVSIDTVLAADHLTGDDLIIAIREAMIEFVQTEDGAECVALVGDLCPVFEALSYIPERISLKHGWLHYETVDHDTVVAIDPEISVMPDDNEILGLEPDGKIVLWDMDAAAPCVSDTLEAFLREDGELTDVEVDRLMRRYPARWKRIESVYAGEVFNAGPGGE